MMAEVKSEKKKKIEDYEVSSAVDTLIRAEEIKGNPELMSLVSKEIGKKKSAINSIAALKDVASKKIREAEEEKGED